MLGDVRQTVRNLRRSPGLTIALILTLALGVGVNGALFTVLDRILFKNPEGVRNAAEVHRLYWAGKSLLGDVHPRPWFSAPDLEAFRRAMPSAIRVAAFSASDARLLDIDGDTNRFNVTAVTQGYFALLGVGLQRGRFFTDDEVRYGDPRYVAVLSDAFWCGRFGRDESIVGRKIRILMNRDTATLTVIGVTEPGFAGIDADVDEIWLPFTARGAANEGGSAWWTQRGIGVASLIARVPTGFDPRSVEARLTAVHRQVNAGQNWYDPNARTLLAPLIEARGPLLGVASTPNAIREIALATRLGGMAIVVLLLAIANAAALLLMRSLWRQRELAVCVALGVTRAHLVRRFVVEGMLITILVATIATIFAYWTGGLLRPLLFSTVKWPRHVLDERLVLLVVGMTALSMFVSSIGPFTFATRQDVMSALKAGGYGSGNPASRLRSTFLATQTAICVTLLSAAGLFIQSLRKASTFDLGYDASRLLSAQAFAYMNQPPHEAFDELARRIAMDPDVEIVSRVGLGSAGGTIGDLALQGRDPIPMTRAPHFDFVDGNWATAIGLRVRGGRTFNAQDLDAGAPVSMINQTMARQYWPSKSPVGECLGLRTGCSRIVGVFDDVRLNIAQPPTPLYVVANDPMFARRRQPSVLARFNRTVTDEDVARTRAMLVSLVGPTRAQLVVSRPGSSVERQLRPWRVAAGLLSAFGFVALASAAASVFGLVAFDVGRRAREIGIRTTLGATPGRVIQDVIRPSMRVIAIGIIVGTGVALLSGRLMAALLFETSAMDPAVLAGAAVVLGLVALLAGFVPALRAARANPVTVLNSD